MRHYLLATAVCALASLTAPANATVVFSENFNAAAAGNYGTGQTVGQFTVLNNDVDIFGSPNTAYACPSPNNGAGNYCLDLNGNANGTISTAPLQLTMGEVYTVAFKMAGNGEPAYPSNTYPYTFDVTLGGETHSFSIAPLAAFQDVSFQYTATSPLPVSLVFKSTYSGIPTYWGAVLDDISVTSATTAVPEPATWAMLVMGFGLVGAAARRRPAGQRQVIG